MDLQVKISTSDSELVESGYGFIRIDFRILFILLQFFHKTIIFKSLILIHFEPASPHLYTHLLSFIRTKNYEL